MDCTKKDLDGAPCGTCRNCRAVEVRNEVNAVVESIESDLREIRARDICREANMAINEAIVITLKHKVK